MNKGWIIGLLAVVLGIAVIGIATVMIATSDDDTLVLDLERQECFQLPEDMSQATLDSVDLVECADPHEAEVFATGELNPDRDLPYPADGEQLFARVDQLCQSVLSEQPGLSEQFGILPVVPNEVSWDSYRGRYLCVAIPYGGGTTSGSLGV